MSRGSNGGPKSNSSRRDSDGGKNSMSRGSDGRPKLNSSRRGWNSVLGAATSDGLVEI